MPDATDIHATNATCLSGGGRQMWLASVLRFALGFNEKPYLLKVDVDGPDLQVLQGANRTLQSCAAVVIEAPLMQIPERSKYLTDRGFRLVDTVDLSYYRGLRFNVAGRFGLSVCCHIGFERGAARAPI
jgi:Methyltransferase FkbM domain